MKNRVNLFVSILFSILILSSLQNAFSQNVGPEAYINVNNIYLPFNNKGDIGMIDIPGHYATGYFEDHEFLFSAGFFMSGSANGELWANGVTGGSLVEDYLPGLVSMNPPVPEVSIYKVSTSDVPFGQSWQDWIDAVSLGADFYDGNHDGVYNPIDLNNNGVWDPDEDKPDIIGDENFWCVYNDGVPANERYWGCAPLGIEIRQTIFAFASSENLGNVVFIRYRIKNTGLISDTLKDIYICNYADSDIGEIGYNHNLTGIDTLRNSDYTYMKHSSPLDWGDNPPCFMTDLLAGPQSYIPGVTFDDLNGNNIYDPGIDIPIDTAFCFRGPLGVPFYPGALNLKVTSSVYYLGGDPVLAFPYDVAKVRNNLLGTTTSGNIVDPCNWPYGSVTGGVPCNEIDPFYWGSGDPVSNIGWISTAEGDTKNIQSTGPFKLIKNKEMEILSAFEVGRGDSALGSVTIAKNISDEIQDFYENNFGYPYVLDVKDKNMNNLDFSLYQNYPNPFNPVTRVKYTIPQREFVNLVVYDILGNEVKVLKNIEQNAGSYEVNFDASGLSSGVYFYTIRAGKYFETKKMILLK